MNPARPHDRPPAFTYVRQKVSPGWHLLADAVPLEDLAAKYGTPLYVYSGSTIRSRFEQFTGAFRGVRHTVCYSVKANSNLAILKLLAGLGAGFDVVSGGELQRVEAASRKSLRHVVFSGVGKQADEIDLALRAGILLFNVESAAELELLASRATHLQKTAKFAIRVNPDVKAETHPYITTGLHEHKFGVPLGSAMELYRSGSGSTHLKAAGVSVHIGSQISDMQPFRDTMERVRELALALRREGHQVEYIDAGGGLGISYDEAPSDGFAARVKAYAEAVTRPLNKLGVHLLLEPGRSIVGPTGVLLTRIVYLKQNDHKRFVVVDAAMNDLMRPSLYGAYHGIVPVRSAGSSARGDKADVVGPVCESGDFFARARRLPPVRPGDLLAILDAGAYGMSLASNYNTRPRSAEVMVNGKRMRVIRKRESIRDLLALEHP